MVRLLQLKKAEFPILSTLFGIVMEVRLLHSEKAYSPIFVIPSERRIETRLLQLENMRSPISVTPPGMRIEVRLPQLRKVSFPNIVKFELSEILTEVRLLQSLYLQPVITQYFVSNKSEIWA